MYAMHRPLIGICTDHVRHFPEPDVDRSYLKLYPPYCNSIAEAGATPLVIPIMPRVDDIRPLLSLVQGVLMIGSDDYPAEWYGKAPAATDGPVTPERAAFDREFVRVLYDETDLPVLAICGGMQLAAIFSGGTLIQDLPQAGLPGHRPSPDTTGHHAVEIAPDSILARALGASRIEVNSLHHQAVESTGPRLRVTAHADDGVIEALEFKDHAFRLGVQWHPERMAGDENMARLFRAFVDEAARRMAQPV